MVFSNNGHTTHSGSAGTEPRGDSHGPGQPWRGGAWVSWSVAAQPIHSDGDRHRLRVSRSPETEPALPEAVLLSVVRCARFVPLYPFLPLPGQLALAVHPCSRLRARPASRENAPACVSRPDPHSREQAEGRDDCTASGGTGLGHVHGQEAEGDSRTRGDRLNPALRA